LTQAPQIVDILALTREELEDFQTTSRELEAEMEADLERSTKLEKELRERAAKTDSERDEWKVRRFPTLLSALFTRLLHRASTCPFKQHTTPLQLHYNGSSTSCGRNTSSQRQLSGISSSEQMI